MFAQQTFAEGTTRQGPTEKLEKDVLYAFTKLGRGVYLHGRPEGDIFKLPIDSFRIRQADYYDFETKTTSPIIYAGAPSSVAPFRQYLVKAANTGHLLPPWWMDAKINECASFGESGAWSDLRRKVTKSDIAEHYGDAKMPMQLCILAYVMYGCGTMRRNVSSARKAMTRMENGSTYLDMFGLR